MLETIDARCTLDIPPRGMTAWHYSRSASGISKHRHPEPAPGISLLEFTRTPAGDNRLRVEGNLTACLYGKEAAVASLDGQDLDDAADAFVAAVEDMLGKSVPERSLWDLHRLDPSRTVQLPEHLDSSEVVAAAERAWSVKANARQVVSRHNRETVVYRHSQWRSWAAYDKTSEAASRGLTAPPRAVRLEARIRPRKGSGLWKLLAPTLALTVEDRDMIAMESEELLTTLAAQIGATTTVGTVRALMRGGATVNQAMRLSSFLLVSDTLGQDVLNTLGIPERTAQRWRADARRYYAAGGGDEAYEADGQEMVPVLARQLVEAMSEQDKQ